MRKIPAKPMPPLFEPVESIDDLVARLKGLLSEGERPLELGFEMLQGSRCSQCNASCGGMVPIVSAEDEFRLCTRRPSSKDVVKRLLNILEDSSSCVEKDHQI